MTTYEDDLKAMNEQMASPDEPERCTICRVPVVILWTCEPCSAAGYETTFCWACSRYHRENHRREAEPEKR